MRPEALAPTATGHLTPTVSGAFAFVPDPAPRILPLSLALTRLNGLVERRLGELAGAAGRVVNAHLVSAPLLRQEALMSSRIEGTVATPEQVALIEMGNAPVTPDANEVNNFVRATHSALQRLEGGDVIAGPLIKSSHQLLMQGVRGNRERPGEYRDAQNFIGSSTDIHAARFVPPPPLMVEPLLADLERFMNDDTSELPSLIRAAIAHYQFEAIHPFRDGNGRIGRLLVTLLLVRDEVLSGPLLPISAAIEKRRTSYGDALLGVSMQGDWNTWLQLFLECALEASELALRQVNGLVALRENWRSRFLSARASALLLKLVDHLFLQPAVSIGSVGELLAVTPATASARIKDLEKAGILRETTGRVRDRIYVAPDILRFIGGEAADTPRS